MNDNGKKEPGQVSISMDLNPNATDTQDPWNANGMYFSNDEFQPNAAKWGKKGWASNQAEGLDPGANENRGDEGTESWEAEFAAQMMSSEMQSEIETDILLSEMDE